MRRTIAAVSALAILLFVPLAIVSARAQEATPAAQPNLTVGQLAPIGPTFELVPGTDVQFINEGPTAHAPGQNLVLYRVVLRPGGEVPAHVHPGTTVLSVEEGGAFSWTLLEGTVTVTRPGGMREEVSTPGTEIVLQPGEGLAYNADVVHTARAAGDEPASVLIASLWEIGQPGFVVTNEQGTPSA